MQDKVAGLRRFGAAALDLAWVAAGRLDGYWERNLSPWDIAAGIILVREAGGFVTDLDGGEAMFATGDIVAGNETIHRELLRAAQGRRKGLTAGQPPGQFAPKTSILRAWDAQSAAASPSFPPCLCHIVRRPTRGAQPDGARSRSVQAFLAPDLSGPDAGVPDPLRAGRRRPLQADLGGLPRQSRPQRADHRRAGDRHPARVPAGDPAVSRGRTGSTASGSPIPGSRSSARRCCWRRWRRSSATASAAWRSPRR